MAKKAKRRAWTAADVRTLKTAAKKKTRAPSIARSLKRTEGVLVKRHSAWGFPSILGVDARPSRSQELSPAEVRGLHFRRSMAEAIKLPPCADALERRAMGTAEAVVSY